MTQNCVMVVSPEEFSMHVPDELENIEKSLASMGARIRKDAREAGATFSYMDPSHPHRIVVEHPDGSVEYKLLSDDNSKSQVHR